MEIDTWIGGMKVRAFPWVDGENIYVNVQYFKPGQSIMQAPAWDKSILLANDRNGNRLVYEFTHSLVNYISGLNIPSGGHAILSVKC